MKITLRKANAIQSSIVEAIKNVEIVTNISIDEFRDSEDMIKKSNNVLMSNIQTKIDLTYALYDIRILVGNANVHSGINTKLAEIARLEKIVQLYTNLSSTPVRVEENVINGKLEKIRNSKDDNYYRTTEVSTSVLNSQEIENFRSTVANYKKAKQRLQDEVLESNVRTEIELSEETVQVLTRERIL